MPRKIEISHRTIIFTFLFLGLIIFVYHVRNIIFLLFLSLLFTSALDPAVDSLERLRLPRWLGIALLYLVTISAIVTAIASVIPPLVEQSSSLISQLPAIVQDIKFANVDATAIASQFSQLSQIPANIVKFTAGIFSNIIFIFTLAVLTFYILMERKNLHHYLDSVFGGEAKKIDSFVSDLERQLGSWVRGELILMSAIGLLSFIGLTLLNVPYALPLAIIAGLLEVIPTIGPIISAVPAILAGLLISPYTSVAVAALYFIVQQTENSLLVPKIMEQATGVNPLVSLVALMIGFEIAGPAGAILAIPILLTAKVTFQHFLSRKFFSH